MPRSERTASSSRCAGVGGCHDQRPGGTSPSPSSGTSGPGSDPQHSRQPRSEPTGGFAAPSVCPHGTAREVQPGGPRSRDSGGGGEDVEVRASPTSNRVQQQHHGSAAGQVDPTDYGAHSPHATAPGACRGDTRNRGGPHPPVQGPRTGGAPEQAADWRLRGPSLATSLRAIAGPGPTCEVVIPAVGPHIRLQGAPSSTASNRPPPRLQAARPRASNTGRASTYTRGRVRTLDHCPTSVATAQGLRVRPA
jgi:hypothetical protein